MTRRNAKSETSSGRVVNPFLGVLLDTDMPALMFQPMKLMALSQIHCTALINRRIQAYAAWPHEVMSARSPTDLMHANVRFLQNALHDYADVMGTMAEAWTGVLEGSGPPRKPGRRRHDYLALPSEEDEGLRAGDQAEPSRLGREASSGARACAA